MSRPEVRSYSLRRVINALLIAGAVSIPQVVSAQSLPWMNTAIPPDQRAQLLINAMTLDQKLAQMAGAPGIIAEVPSCYGGRHVPGIPALQIPTFRVFNGPVGVGQADCVPASTPGIAQNPTAALTSTLASPATAIPSALAMAASFDTTVAAQFGDLIGKEALNLGLHEWEAPGMDMARVPMGGRNFEYYGEDPFLSGTMAVAAIKAAQSRGVIAMAKYIVANDQEVNRQTINEIIADRVLHELYLIPFEMSVKDGQVGSVMCSYNSVNAGQTFLGFNQGSACQNSYILTQVLRNEWGFTGYVQSDFFANHSTAPSLLAGMDFEMPGIDLGAYVPSMAEFYSPAKLQAAITANQITVANIETALKRRYTQMFKYGIFDRPITITSIDAATDGQTAQSIGVQSAVLLKNNGNLLPLNSKAVRSVAVIGQAAYATKSVSGCCGGSSDVIPLYTVTPLQGIQNSLAALGSSATANLTVVADDNSNLSAAVAAAQSADVVIVMAGLLAEEGADAPSISLPNNQDAMISAIAAANPKTVVVLKTNAAALMPWVGSVPAILDAWFPGEEDGNIVAKLLFGQANPSGKLPVTFPVLASDLPTAGSPQQYPGVSVNGTPTITYSEGLDMGYRWYDSQNIAPLFPFGYGLSYTTFSISGLTVTPAGGNGAQPVTVSFFVRNTGTVAGAEVPQVYLGLPSGTGEPPKRLVGFKKVFLQPGQTQQVSITIDPAASNHPFSTFDSPSQQWKMVDGSYAIFLGNSSRDPNALTAALPIRQASPFPATHQSFGRTY